MSRFTRDNPSSAGVEAKPTAPQQVTSNNSASVAKTPTSAEGEAQLRTLQERQRKLQERRMRREIDRDNALKEIQACEKTAQEIGISNLDELKAKVEQLEQEDRLALERFVKMLDEEEALLDRVDRALADLERGQ